MRPRRIRVEGFAAFREAAEIDLDDVELFALVGPTGAGKSSVIDAMVFALYGCVPRYDSENLVHPVITQGALEARVRLDFTVGGTDYTATRVVRRTKTGATTKEARLERDDGGEQTTVLADEAKGLTAAVGELLGLDLEQFTKCVVLPQGAFATLLHDTKAKRQDLLVKLLDLGLYEQVAAAARAEAKSAGFRLETLDEQLQGLAHATDDAVLAAGTYVDAVDGVVVTLDRAVPDFAALDDERRAIDADLAADVQAMELLAGVTAPGSTTEVVGRAAETAEAAEAAQLAEQQAAEVVRAAEEARDALPAEAALRELLTLHAQGAELAQKVERGRAMLAELEQARPELVAAADAASAAVAVADEALGRARIDHAAADLARHLHEGDDCPVCGNTVVRLVVTDGRALAVAEEALVAARADEAAATAALTAHDQTAGQYRARLEVLTGEHVEVGRRLQDQPAVAELERQLQEVAAADQRLGEARAADRAARQAAAAARDAAEAAAHRVSAARAEFQQVRDRLAVLGPPVSGDDLGTDWKALVVWADTTRDERESRSAEARRRLDDVEHRRRRRCAELAEQASAIGIPVPAGADPAALRDACVTEAASARARQARLADERDRRAELAAERRRLDERRAVHDLLAEQLGARGFEAWLLDEALELLLQGASRWLEQLSSGRYAMAVDDKNQFAVIDHANADERRLARTLSGGETFLASLALALALAEQVGELSAGGGRGLEAIFLDEGFGTLDPDTLDVVASAIEELGATGRMVGVVSHVPELAERVPVRFEVTKGPGTSAVRRVER